MPNVKIERIKSIKKHSFGCLIIPSKFQLQVMPNAKCQKPMNNMK